MSKTCLEVLTNLGKAFQTAIKEGLSVKSGPLAPYTVCNDTGMTVTLLLRDSHFKVRLCFTCFICILNLNLYIKI